MSRRDDDDDGQVDGDAPFRGAMVSPFATTMRASPWLRGALPPWHLWGTTTEVTIPIDGPTTQRSSQQMTRVSYLRPDTWHWLFFARIVSGEKPPGSSYGFGVNFNVTVGLGRASVTLPSFMAFSWLITAPAPVPFDDIKWSSQGNRPARFAGDTAGFIDQMVAQDIQVSADVILTSGIFPLQPLVLQIGSFWAPKNHVRPDWFQVDGVPEAQFPGSEIGGK